MIGQRLGQYRVTLKIAQGGMGGYEAHQRLFDFGPLEDGTVYRWSTSRDMKSIDYTIKAGRSVVYENEELLDVQPLLSQIVYQNDKFVARAGDAVLS